MDIGKEEVKNMMKMEIWFLMDSLKRDNEWIYIHQKNVLDLLKNMMKMEMWLVLVKEITMEKSMENAICIQKKEKSRK